MNVRSLLIIAAVSTTALASCSTAPARVARDPRAAEELAKALAGRTAGPAVRCLPAFSRSDMDVIDDDTILYREGRTVYLQRPRGGCPGLNIGNYTLVIRKYGSNQTCDGDFGQLVDLRTGFGGGSCVFGPFIPYTKS